MTRRTGKIAAPSQGNANIAENEDTAEVVQSSARESGDESDSSSNNTKSSQKRRATKRPKLSTGSKTAPPATKATSRKQKSLSLLPEMPLDVIFEIFGSLAPKDLISVSLINKNFRQTLLSSSANTVWAATRDRVGAPKCPSDFTEARWTALLFGTHCQSCGASKALKIDFFLRRRVCHTCRSTHTILRSTLQRTLPVYIAATLSLETILSLIPSTNATLPSKHLYWKPEVESTMQKLADYRRQIELHVQGAQEAMKMFLTKRTKFVSEISSTACIHTAWADHVALERHRHNGYLKEQRENAIKKHFLELGYTSDEISSVRHESAVKQTTALTDRIWERIRPMLEPQVFNKRVSNRRAIVHKLYNSYKDSLLPPQWRCLPRTLVICRFQAFSEYVNDLVTAQVTEETFADCMQLLPELLANRQEILLTSLTSMIQSTRGVGEPLLPLNCIEMATSVFMCAKRGCMTEAAIVGTDEILSHQCGRESAGLPVEHQGHLQPLNYAIKEDFEDTDKTFYLSSYAIAVSKTLIGLVGLKTETALALEMDAKDCRFACATYPSQKCGYSWRSAIYHNIQRHSHNPTLTIRWTVLSDENATIIKSKEEGDTETKWLQHLWTCARCSRSKDADRAEVVVHLSEMHDISNPAMPADFFFFERSVMHPIHLYD